MPSPSLTDVLSVDGRGMRSSTAMWAKVASGAVVLALTVSCGSSGRSVYKHTPAASVAHSTPRSTATVHPTGAVFGATVSEWAATHRVDNSASEPANTFYDPDPSLDLPDDKGKTADRFNGLMTDGGRVDYYNERFAPHTTLATARSIVRDGLPKDATNVWFAVLPNCAAEVLHSNQLATWFASTINDNSGLVLVEYVDRAGNYDASNIQRANLMATRDYPTAQSLKKC
jgi:hypothetical protein